MLRRRDYYRALAVYGLVLCVFRVFAFGVQALIRFMGSGAKLGVGMSQVPVGLEI